MADAFARNPKTFSLQTPQDLYGKLQFEARALHNAPPDDLTERSYAVMNAVTTAWQMKDWVYAAMEAEGSLERLHQYANRKIKNGRDFGKFLTERSPWMEMCFHLATAAKHFEVSTDTGREVVTSVDFRTEPSAKGTDLIGSQEIMVATPNNSISGPDLVLLLEFIWSRTLVDLGLMTEAGFDHRSAAKHE